MKDEALKLALKALELHGKQYPHMVKGYCLDAITAIEQALAAPVQEPFCFYYVENGEEYFAPKGAYVPDNAQPLYTTLPAAPVAWKWHQAPVKTSWGHDMVVADLAIDKDNTVSVYCERDQTTKVEAMFTPPAAPVQEPVATVTSESGNPDVTMSWWHEPPLPVGTKLYTTPPAAQQEHEPENEPHVSLASVQELDCVLVPRDLIGAACSAIDRKRDAPKTLEQLRRYTVGDLSTPPAQPAVPDAFGTREGEHPQYIQGWNDCRAEMLKGKP